MTRWTAVWRPGGWRFLNLQNCWTSGGYGGKGGGGRKDFAQAGGQDQSKIEEAFEKLKGLV